MVAKGCNAPAGLVLEELEVVEGTAAAREAGQHVLPAGLLLVAVGKVHKRVREREVVVGQLLEADDDVVGGGRLVCALVDERGAGLLELGVVEDARIRRVLGAALDQHRVARGEQLLRRRGREAGPVLERLGLGARVEGGEGHGDVEAVAGPVNWQCPGTCQRRLIYVQAVGLVLVSERARNNSCHDSQAYCRAVSCLHHPLRQARPLFQSAHSPGHARYVCRRKAHCCLTMPPATPPPRASHSRASSTASARLAHAPTTPSQLRHAHAPSDRSSSPEDLMHHQPPQASALDMDLEPTARTRLLDHHDWDAGSACADANCTHAAASPRPPMGRNYGSFAGSVHSENSFGGAFPAIADTADGDAPDAAHALLGDAFADGLLNAGNSQKMSTTRWLAERHGIKNKRIMYLQYYIPVLNWTRQYKWRYFKGDLVAAITMASFYIPMALSYASNLAHLPPVHGLYSFALNPLIYAILGTCPQMIVGPEAPGSLLVGEIVRENIKKGTTGDQDGRRNAEIAGVVTCMAGAFILVAGLFRLGFLDNVLSRPFLRGFISAIGVVIFVDQLIPEMGLARLAADQVSHGSCLDKAVFLFRNVGRAHGLTCAMSFTAFGIIMFFR